MDWDDGQAPSGTPRYLRRSLLRRTTVPKYLFQASYTSEGAKESARAVLQRRAMVKELIEKAGGKLETFYFAFGDADAIIIAGARSHTTAAGISLAVNAPGGHHPTTVLLTPEESTRRQRDGGLPAAGILSRVNAAIVYFDGSAISRRFRALPPHARPPCRYRFTPLQGETADSGS
jgi:uncharacterized protein with GYD domain